MSVKFQENERPFVERAENYCAASEQCASSVRAKLLVWGASHELTDKVMKHLKEADFINEMRYAKLYCGSKLRQQKWGKVKMAYQLRAKQIPRNIIDAAIASVDEQAYKEALQSLLVEKWALLASESDDRKRRVKLTNFLASKGFEASEIQECIQNNINE